MAINLSNFKLTFDDEFNSFTSTPQGQGNWQTTLNGARTFSNNGEQQFYSDSTVGVNPFSLQNGELTITASPGSNPAGLWYNSGAISTLGDFSQQYGYFEMRAELPQGAGMWPAFWLLPSNHTWPPELDVLEAFGAANNGQGGSNLVHLNAISTVPGQSGGEWVAVSGAISSGYHAYGVDWESDFLTYYIDGAAVGQLKTPDDMHQPMYMMANLAVGGSWAGSAAGETSQMKIDYVRAYSNNPYAWAAATQPISSPDGVDTSPFAPRGAAAGADSLVLRVAQDWYNGNAQYTVTVDGKQVGSILSASASHAAGQWQDVALTGSFGNGPHTVVVNFLNDAWAPSAQIGHYANDDRNLYVQSITLNGETVAGKNAENHADSGGWGPAYDSNAAVFLANGSALLHTLGTGTISSPAPAAPTAPTPSAPSVGAGNSPVTLHVSEDAWNGNAQFNVFVDGSQVGGTQTATASHAAGQWQDITVNGSFGSGPHTVGVQFLNDGWGGWSGADRNLYVQSIDINGQHIAGNTATNNAAAGMGSLDTSAAVMAINGEADFKSGTASSTSSSLTLHVSEDAWNGNAQFNVFVDGNQVGGTQTATASHAAGQWQDITLTGDYGVLGPDKISIQFLNDAWGGSSITDRNLYVLSLDINAVHLAGNTAANTAVASTGWVDVNAASMDLNGIATFDVHHTAPPTGWLM